MSYRQLKKLRCVFPKLTEINQVYILGLVEGLKCAQGKNNGISLVKKEVVNCFKHDINDIC